MGLNGLEPSTSRLSGVRSNQLSYKPIEDIVDVNPFKYLVVFGYVRIKLIRQPLIFPGSHPPSIFSRLGLNRRVRDGNGCFP